MSAVETVQFFELDQPLCSHIYGLPPCTAAIDVTGTRKCFNTRGTCQDPANYDGSALVELRFARPQEGLEAYGPLIPSLQSCDTTPGSINLAAMDESISALGSREVATVKLADHLHSDLQVDPYRLERITGDAQSSYYASTPDSAALAIAGDIDLRFNIVGLADWTPAADQFLLSHGDLDTDHSFLVQINGDGRIGFLVSNDGSTITTVVSGLPTGFADGSSHWLRVTRAAATGVVTFYTSSDGVTWTPLDVPQASPAGALWNSTQLLVAGGMLRYRNHIDGTLYLAELRSGIGGSVVAAFDRALLVPGDSTLTSATGEIWTLNQAGAYDPHTRGTFWGKWIARNPYHQHLVCRVREGAIGDALSDMRVRHYVLDRIDGPTDGRVTLVAKDAFTLIEALKSVAPRASRGELLADISAVAGSATLAPAGIGVLDYPTPGHVAIGDELVAYTRAADVLTLTARGAFNSEADTHDAQDLVQLVLSYVAQPAYLIVYDLLVNYSSIDPALIDLPQWAIDAAELTGVYTARIVEPTPVADLIGELAAQAGFTVWPEVSTGMIRFVPLRAQALTATLDDDGWIVDGSLSLKRASDKRVSQAWVYYGQINPVLKLDERRNYRSRAIVADLASEGDDQYGTPALREIYSRWIAQFGRTAAQYIGRRVLTQFRDPPLEVKLSIHASRDGAVALARYFALRTADVQDDIGATLDTTFAVIEIERGEDEIEVRGQQVKFFTGGDVAGGDRVIYIENDIADVNLRAIHDSLYAVPLGGSPGEQVRFILLAGNVVYASSAAGPAVATGLWPAGVDLVLEVHGRIDGAGGSGGRGGDATSAGPTAGAAGLVGGLALLATYPIEVDGDGVIAGGGGGGGGGGAAVSTGIGGQRISGGGGGSGAGQVSPPGAPAGGTSGGLSNFPGGPGSSGSELVAGDGGAGGFIVATFRGGDAGDGGAPGAAGSAGQAGDASGGVSATASAGGTGGPAGKSIQGIAFVTLTGTVTLIGATA